MTKKSHQNFFDVKMGILVPENFFRLPKLGARSLPLSILYISTYT